MIVRKGRLVEGIRPSADFRVRVVYVTAGFIELSTPQSNYGMKGQLSLFLNPVMRLDAGQQARCRRNFDLLATCVADVEHHFYRDMLVCAVQMMILDFFDFHSHLYDEDDLPLQSASLMSRFLGMLEDGEFRRHREVGYYADRLCVSPKYLSEVSLNVSGYAANFWINRYTALDIARQLRDKSLTLTDIAYRFGFSSPAHFSRYVQQHLGMPPPCSARTAGVRATAAGCWRFSGRRARRARCGSGRRIHFAACQERVIGQVGKLYGFLRAVVYAGKAEFAVACGFYAP